MGGSKEPPIFQSSAAWWVTLTPAFAGAKGFTHPTKLPLLVRQAHHERVLIIETIPNVSRYSGDKGHGVIAGVRQADG
jgi:hypothetical protein